MAQPANRRLATEAKLAADLSTGLATKVNSSTYTAGLAGKQDAATLDAATATNVTSGAATSAALRAALGSQRRYSPRVAFEGDSITATSCDPANNIMKDSWATTFVLSSNGRARYVFNDAIGGTTTTQMAARFAANVLAKAPDTVILLGGTNDGLDGNSQPTVTAANIKAMVAACLAQGVRPVLCTIPPSGTAALGAPGTPQGSVSATGGSIPAGTYSYSVTATNGVGETTGGGILSGVVTTGATSSVSLALPVKQGAAGYKIYRNNGTNWQIVGTATSPGSSWTPPQSFTDTAASGTVVTPPGSDTTGVTPSTTVRTKILRINAWIKRYAALNNLDLIDFYALLVDSTSGLYQTGLTRDGTHPTSTASRQMGQLAWNTLSALWSAAPPNGVLDPNDTDTLMTNGLFTTNNGVVPSGWSSFGGNGSNFTDAVGTVAGIAGKAFTTSRADNTPRYHGAPTISTGFSVGDVLAFTVRLKTTGLEANNVVGSIGVSFTGSTGATNGFAVELTADVGPGLWYSEATVPAGTTALAPSQNISNNSGGSVITGEWTIRNLTTGQLLNP